MELNVFQRSPCSSSSLFLCSSKPNNKNVKLNETRVKKFHHRYGVKSKAQVYNVESTRQDDDVVVKKDILNPVYTPTPSNRPTRTPHSGYHFDGTTRKFFEGWYFKVSIPEQRQSFCFMYSVENPAFRKELNGLEQLQYGPRFTGVGAQILGADDKYICQYTKESQNFWGSRHELKLGNSFSVQKGKRPPKSEVSPQVFNQSVGEGFQVTPLWHQGSISDDGRTSYAETVKTARWEYSTRPVYGWGDVGSKQKSTAGWLAAFPVFEPHWQICMAGGLSTGMLVFTLCRFVNPYLIAQLKITDLLIVPLGCKSSAYDASIFIRPVYLHFRCWIEWGDERYEFQNAPSYCEKNWGGGFPRKWFWVQCNVFKGASGEVALTCGGGLRQLPGLHETFENAALLPWSEITALLSAGQIGVHFGGIFYEFVPWNGVVEWEIAQWGHWHVTADNETHKLILDVTSNMAAVEVGGGPWFNTWKGKTHTPEIINQALNVPVDVDGILGSFSLFKPPGL
ncbi:tocopherol cyclase [Tanacetum coccineum]